MALALAVHLTILPNKHFIFFDSSLSISVRKLFDTLNTDFDSWYHHTHLLHLTRHFSQIRCQRHWWQYLEIQVASICRNKMPTRCNRWFLLQILLLAQHVSGTTTPIIRSSRVLYRRVVCPVCGLQPANRTHNPQLHTIPTTWKPKH